MKDALLWFVVAAVWVPLFVWYNTSWEQWDAILGAIGL